MIFRLPILTYNKLSLLDNKESNLSVVHTQFSTIEYLVIDHTCNLNSPLAMIHLYNHIESQDHLILSRFSYIYITNCSLQFDEFETFITYRDTAYLDDIRWEQLISQYMPHLHRFDFNHYHKLQYNKSFWRDKQSVYFTVLDRTTMDL
jgi:hypothetical protein